MNGAGVRQEGGTAEGSADILGEAPGGGVTGQAINGVDALARRIGQVAVTA